MIDTGRIRGVLFDYGGTIDSNGVHWAEIIWQAYQAENTPVTKEIFREAYIHGERTLGKNPIIQPYHTFLDMMRLKIAIQIEWLQSLPQPLQKRGAWENDTAYKHRIADRHCEERSNLYHPAVIGSIADFCYNYARTSIEKARPVIEWMADKYPLALVSNFYGNMKTVLKDFGIAHFFPIIIESAIVGVRKPDPRIFSLGVEALQLRADEVVVIGDSYDKDIIPAKTAGCQTIWLKNTGWNDYTGTETADWVITDFAELVNKLRIDN